VSDGRELTPTERTRAKRLADRASYARADIDAVLDAAIACSVGYVIDGRPYVTTTAHWRDGDRLYWHGSSASRFLKSVVGEEACLTAFLLDGLVLARSGFEHSMNYRSVTVFGRVERVEGAEAERALDAFVEKLVPGRSTELRRPTEQELRATTVLAMPITEASAKIRDGGTHDPQDDWDEPVWAGVLTVETRFGELIPETDPPPKAPVSDALRALLGRRR
jgi:nitroimidazol reductase NimA-like FMN-containing flavoprotein (pyridoxamine 5'-phosphate oxidase superfamily)